MNNDDMQPLIYEGDTDYTLKPDEQSIWISVGGISVYIQHAHECVSVSLYKLGDEIEKSLDNARAYYDE